MQKQRPWYLSVPAHMQAVAPCTPPSCGIADPSGLEGVPGISVS